MCSYRYVDVVIVKIFSNPNFLESTQGTTWNSESRCIVETRIGSGSNA